MLEAEIRDVNKKGKILRNSGLVTGSIKRKSGEVIHISIVGFKLETYIKRNGLNKHIPINFNNEELNVKIDRLQRNSISHNIMNIDTTEI